MSSENQINFTTAGFAAKATELAAGLTAKAKGIASTNVSDSAAKATDAAAGLTAKAKELAAGNVADSVSLATEFATGLSAKAKGVATLGAAAGSAAEIANHELASITARVNGLAACLAMNGAANMGVANPKGVLAGLVGTEGALSGLAGEKGALAGLAGAEGALAGLAGSEDALAALAADKAGELLGVAQALLGGSSTDFLAWAVGKAFFVGTTIMRIMMTPPLPGP